MDINESVHLKDQLQQKLRFEKLISEISAKFINLPAAEIDRNVRDGLQLVSELIDVDEIFILQFQVGKEMAGVTHGWFRSGKVRELEFKASEFPHVLPWAGRKILENEVIVFERIDELPAEAVNEREYLRKVGLESAVVLPMFAGEKNIGAFFIQTLGRKKKWHRDTLSQLTLIAELFSSALDRKNASDKLIESEQRLRAFMDNSPTFMYIKDHTLKHLYANRSLLEYFNISIDEFIGTTARDFLPKNIAKKLEDYDRQVIKKGVPVDTEEISFTPHGKLLCIKEIKFPVTLYSGKVGVGGIVIDITPLKQKERSLQEAYMEILQSILEPTRIAKGNISCSLSEDCENRNIILYEEIWDTESDLKHHMRSDRFRNILAAIDMASEQPEIRFSTVSETAGMEFIEKVLK